MDKTEKISDKEITEEDLLDFELDDLSPEDLGEGVGSKESDDDILELVDLVEQGEQDKLKDSFEGEIADLMKEEDEEISGEGERPEDADTELDLSDISLTDLAAEAEAKPDAMLGEEEIAEAPVEEGMEELPTAAIEMDFSKRLPKFQNISRIGQLVLSGHPDYFNGLLLITITLLFSSEAISVIQKKFPRLIFR